MNNKSNLMKFILLLSTIFYSCNFMQDVKIVDDYNSKVTELKLNKNEISMMVDDSDYLQLKIAPENIQGKIDVNWEYDNKHIEVVSADNYGIVFKAIQAGNAYIKAKCNGISATTIVTITENLTVTDEPYIYSSLSNVIEMKPSETTNYLVSLYGGGVADMEDFTFEVVNPDIIELIPSRNNCIINAKTSGSTQVKVSHPKAKYDYTFVVYVYKEVFDATYITTTQNIITIDKAENPEVNINVDLINPQNNNYASEFIWEYYDEESKEIIDITSSNNTALITGKSHGLAKIKVSHPNSEYALEIQVRVITIVQNTHITLSKQTVVIKGSNSETIYANVENYDDYVDVDAFEFVFEDGAEQYIDYQVNGNSLLISGKKNGVTKCSVSHELSEKTRTLLIICQEQIVDAVDSSVFITTSQNYVNTKVGAEATALNVSLIGGLTGDENNFEWKITEVEGTDVFDVEFVNGKIVSSSRSAVQSGNIATGQLIFSPISPGSVEIEVSHPRSLYPVKIKAKVFSEFVLFEDPVEIKSEISLIKILNGESAEVEVSLQNASSGDENNIKWTSEKPSVIKIEPNYGSITQINAIGTGQNQTYITASHSDAISEKKILILSADTQEELESFKTIYSSTNYFRINKNNSIPVQVEAIGLESNDIISWTSSNPEICNVTTDTESDNCVKASILGISSGKTTITATLDDIKLDFTVYVLEEDEPLEIVENPKYLTTNLNALVFENLNETKDMSITGVNFSNSELINTEWNLTTIEGNNPFSLISNGSSATIESLNYGKAKISVSNPLSKNTLEMNIKCGELYEWTEDYVVYILGDDVVNIVKETSSIIGFSLCNTTENGTFSFSIKEGNDLIEITPTNNGLVTIQAIEAGQAVIEVKNTLCDFTKEVLINISNTEEELKGIKYISTQDNVVTISSTGQKTINVEVMNSDFPITSGFTWEALDSDLINISSSGPTAVIFGKKEGTTKIRVSNTNCDNPFEIIVNVVNPLVAAEDPYIMAQNIATCTIGGGSLSLQAELIGGTEEDNTKFYFEILDNSIASIVTSNNSLMVTGLKEGITQIKITHPKASLSRTITLIVEKKVATNCYINIEDGYYYQLKPGDSPLVINADLINGTEDDIYDFNFYADDYSLINFNYTSNTCVVEPLSTGVVTIHCSHPKSQNTKDIIIYISKFEDFNFEKQNVIINSKTYVNMELPAIATNCDVSYHSSDSSICSVTGSNNYVCFLNPRKEGTVTITAKLLKDNVVIEDAELLVVVEKVDETKPFINFKNSTIITMNKGEKRALSATLSGENIVDTDSQGLLWSIQNTNGTVAEFTTGGVTATGSSVQLKAINSGKTTITISHNDETIVPITLYIIVAGVTDPSVVLSHSNLPLYIGENQQTIIAKLENTTADSLEWSVEPAEQDFFIFESLGSKATILATKPGNATITASIVGTEFSSSCEVIVKEPEKIDLFVYDDDVTQTTKIFVSNFQITPGETRFIHYETIPNQDEIERIYLSDNLIVAQDYGYGAEINLGNKSYSFDKDIGTIAITSKGRQGMCNLQIYTKSKRDATVIINNSYNYLFTIDKSIINLTPDEYNENPEAFYIDYQIRPACSKIKVQLKPRRNGANTQDFQNISLKDGTYSKYVSEENYYIIDTHKYLESTPETGIVSGTLQFVTDGETNCEVVLSAINEEELTSDTSSTTTVEFENHSVTLQCYYPYVTFGSKFLQKVPYFSINSLTNTSYYGSNALNSYYSKFDKTTNSFILGDGEYLDINFYVEQPDSNVKISSATFVPKGSSPSLNSINVDTRDNQISGTALNQFDFKLFHTIDYGWFYYKCFVNSNLKEKSNPNWHSSYKPNVVENEVEKYNSTIRENSFVGNIEIEYYSMFAGTNKTYSIPVYLVCRNVPCYEDSTYYAYKLGGE